MNIRTSRIETVFLMLGMICLSSVPASTTFAAPGDTPPPSKKEHELNPALPTLFVVGDSTASNSAKGQQGWGDPFVNYFDLTKINVLNRARAGRSSRTFQTEGLWDKVLAVMKPGDFVLIQMGHNDAGPLTGAKGRGSVRGTGDETEEIVNNAGKPEVVHTYGWYMRKFIADTKAKGATPIVLSLTVRDIWKEGKVERGSGSFGKWAQEIAAAEGVTFLDMTEIIANRYEQMGQDAAHALFPGDHTHTGPVGAALKARLGVGGLKALKDNPFNQYLSAKGKEITPEPTGVTK